MLAALLPWLAPLDRVVKTFARVFLNLYLTPTFLSDWDFMDGFCSLASLLSVSNSSKS